MLSLGCFFSFLCNLIYCAHWIHHWFSSHWLLLVFTAIERKMYFKYSDYNDERYLTFFYCWLKVEGCWFPTVVRSSRQLIEAMMTHNLFEITTGFFFFIFIFNPNDTTLSTFGFSVNSFRCNKLVNVAFFSGSLVADVYFIFCFKVR